MTIRGSCLCGAVRFVLASPPSLLGVCHCTLCRKAGASAIAFVRGADLRWVQGREDVSMHAPESPYKYGRCFCRHCGTSLGEILSEAESFPISAHALDDDAGLEVAFHEFTAEKPSWHVIGDAARQFPGHPETG